MAKSKDKTSVILYGNMLKAIAKLPAENCLEMMQAISAYVDGAEFKFTSPILEAWFSDMIETFKRDAEAFKATCVKRSEAGKIGNKRRWKEKIEEDGGDNVKDSQGDMDNRKTSQSIAKYRKTSQSIAMRQEQSQDIANIADTETETDIKRKNIYKKEKFIPPKLEEVKAYASEKQYAGFNAEKFHAHYQSNGWKVGKNPMKDWKAAVRYWATNNEYNGGHYGDAKHAANRNEGTFNEFSSGYEKFDE